MTSITINRPDLHEKYFSQKDEAIKKIQIQPSNYTGEWDAFIVTMTRVLEPGKTRKFRLHSDPSHGIHPGWDPDHFKDSLNNFGYRNLRFINASPASINKVVLVSGGQWVDTIYPSITGDLNFGIFTTIDALPAVKYHDWDIEIWSDGKNPITIQYDVVHLKEPIHDDQMKSLVYSNTQCFGPTKVAQENKIYIYDSCFYKHPVSRIRVYTTIPLVKASLVLDEDSSEKEEFNIFTTSSGTIESFELRFDPTINFYRSQRSALITTSEKDGEIYIVSESRKIMRIVNGMIDCE
jgi:hypothetical protein